MADFDDRRRQWIDAAVTLATDPGAKVLCPNRGDAYLEVEDIPYEEGSPLFARYLRCPRCGAVEVLDRLKRT